jgi:signal peptidase I
MAHTTAPRPPATLALRAFILVSVSALFALVFLIQPFAIPSESMENTLLHGDYILANKTCLGAGSAWNHIIPYRPIQRGDIVVFRFPPDRTQYAVKRVIGLPGDRVRLTHDVLIDGKVLSESYVTHRAAVPDTFRDEFPNAPATAAAIDPAWRAELPQHVRDGELVVPPGEYFVLGDNRDESLDSRYWGFVPGSSIVGKPLLIYWSMDLPERPPFADSIALRLSDFGYAVTHVFQLTRWNRLLRAVR